MDEPVVYDAGEYLRLVNEELEFVYPESVRMNLLDSEQLERGAAFIVDFDLEQLDRNASKKFPFSSTEYFGAQDPHSVCRVCGGIDCIGHYGLFLFPRDENGKRLMIVNPPYIKMVRDIMSVICHECHGILLNPKVPYDARELEKIKALPKAQKLPRLLDLVGLAGLNKITYPECTRRTTTRKGDKIYCQTKHKLLAAGDNKAKIVFDKKPAHAPKKRGKKSVLEEEEEEESAGKSKTAIFLPRDAYEMLMQIPSEQLTDYIGRTKQEIRAYFKTNMVILPPKFRAGGIKDKTDKLTACLINIERYCRSADKGSTETIVKLTDEVSKYEQVIIDINKGKPGLPRKQMLGKRDQFSARAVITPSYRQEIGVITIPQRLAQTALFMPPTVVTESNLDALQSLLYDGQIGTVNKVSGINPWQTIQVGLDNYSDRSAHILQIGDTVQTHLRDGDVIIHGRQPTHKVHNMMGARVKINKGNSIQTSTNAATGYHGDYDGDTMYAMALQTLEAVEEAASQINIDRLIRNYVNNSALLSLVYNGILAAGLLTRTENGKSIPIERDLWLAATFSYASHPRMRTLGKRLAAKGVERYTGAGLFSSLLPEGFHYKGGKKDGGKYVVIEDGILVSGMVSKSSVGPESVNSITDALLMFYDNHLPALNFINDGNAALFTFLDVHGFSISLPDCFLGPTDDNNQYESFRGEVIDLLHQAEYTLLGIKATEDRTATEKEVRSLLTQFDVLGEKHFKATQSIDNPLLYMADPGAAAKGKEGNLRLISITAGQQREGNVRYAKSLSNNTRCTYADRPGDTRLTSQGFIIDSYLTGLTPKATIIASRGNRPGMVQNATATKDVGLIFRHLQDSMSNITTMNGSAVFHNKIVTEWAYGADAADGMYLAKVEDVYQATSLAAMIDHLNALDD
jgi:DNA-directed RNA polymerase beta' subunit